MHQLHARVVSSTHRTLRLTNRRQLMVKSSNAPPTQKYGALNMTSALAMLIMRHPQVRQNMENFLVQHVFPGFNSEYAYIRAIVGAIFFYTKTLH